MAAQWFHKDIDLMSLESELRLLLKYVDLKTCLSLLDLYKLICEDKFVYCNVIILVQLALTLPVTFCSAERYFSKLNWLKTDYARS